MGFVFMTLQLVIPSISCHHFQAVELRLNPLDDDVTGCVVVYFCGLQNHSLHKINMAWQADSV